MPSPAEHPLLMKGPLVRATLEGRKTQTRRLVTPRNSTVEGWKSAKRVWHCLDWSRARPTQDSPGWIVPLVGEPDDAGPQTVRPRVRVGHHLWVRETWGVGTRPCPNRGWVDGIEYRADDHELDDRDMLPLRVIEDRDLSDVREGWHPSIHMPRWACRLVLPVTNVRAERVQEISEDNARVEGVGPLEHLGPSQRMTSRSNGDDRCQATHPCTVSFAALWDEINGHHPGASWADNPPLWVYGWRPVA